MSGAIEALYIYDEHDRPILQHNYRGRPLSAKHLLPLYTSHPQPRPNLIYLPNSNPPTLVFSLIHCNLLFLLTTTQETEPLLILEFLHRLIDILEDFVGAPLLAIKLESNYDVVAQLLNEMVDGGEVATTEPNALREIVEVEGFLGKLFSSVGVPGKPGFSNSSASSNMPGISSQSVTPAPTVPWRRPNVRHTSNELYVDIVETLSVTLAPSGRPLSAFSHGSIAFTAKISGVPDLLLNLSSPSGKHNLTSVMELPVFHPCVRLNRWKERPGELSFIPPDGRFVLMGYEVDLLGGIENLMNSKSTNLKLPVNVEVKTGLGPIGADFEVRVTLSQLMNSTPTSGSAFGSGNSRAAGSLSRLGSNSSGFGTKSDSSPVIEGLIVTVPLPEGVRNIIHELRGARGDVRYNPGDTKLEWAIPTTGPASAPIGSAGITLYCTVASAAGAAAEDDGSGFMFDEGYEQGYQNGRDAGAQKDSSAGSEKKDMRKVAMNRVLMPGSAMLSFGVKGWLPSGIKVESLNLDQRKSKGLGEGVKPYKGVKYLCVSRGGVEVRC